MLREHRAFCNLARETRLTSSRSCKSWYTALRSPTFSKSSVGDYLQISPAAHRYSKLCRCCCSFRVGQVDIGRILFLREFTPLPSSRSLSSSSAVPNGSTTPTGKGADPMKEAFIPENVYDAVKDNKRFDSMRVSSINLISHHALTAE